MPERDHEPFSNPLPPSGMDMRREEDLPAHPMTNEDFRKLLMTPRAPPSAAPPAAKPETIEEKDETDETGDKAEKRKKKKKYYATLKKQEEDKLAELSRKYRDRARERREGANPDYQNEDPITSTAGYRAVAPDAKSGLDAAERRRQMIQESKFLGGDMEHTHLVKGLDYALLQKAEEAISYLNYDATLGPRLYSKSTWAKSSIIIKVRSEITSKEKEEEELERVLLKHQDKEEEEEMLFRTKLGRNIYRCLFKNRHPEKNELFLPSRMAYIIDLEDDYTESDIPTTLIRSKADCPSFESQTTLTTNDIVINKLTQILSYLRQGLANKRGKKKDKGKLKEDDKERIRPIDDSIYGELGEYIPSTEGRDRERERDKDREKRRSYFEKPSTEDDRDRERPRERDRRDKERWGPVEPKGENDLERERRTFGSAFKTDDRRLKAKLTSKLERDMPESYAECYPGAPENEDAVADSDDEVDYSKMDMGNKKGPIGRWDFDTQEEYSEYMSNKEALPKAAFQYGVKMADGRKTRRTGTGKRDEKQKLDRELQKINQIIARRKATEGDGPALGESEYKRPRY